MEPLIELDPFSLVADIEILGHMVWPDKNERAMAMASLGAFVVGSCNLRLKAPVRGDDVETCISLRLLRQHAQVRLLDPSGGLCNAALAKGFCDLEGEYTSALDGGGSSATLVLLIMLRMHLHHNAEFPTSRARAGAIFAAMTDTMVGIDSARAGYEQNLKRSWKKWGRVLPIWAGVMIEAGYPWDQTELRFSRSLIGDRIYESVTCPEGRRRAACYGAWCRERALMFKSPHRGEAFFRASELSCFDWPALEPMLTPLNAAELAVARGTRAIRRDQN